MANVIFKFGKQAQYDALQKKDYNALYWIEDTQRIYKGDVQFSIGDSNDIIQKGYYFENNFYENIEHSIIINPEDQKIYIDISTNKLYVYNNKKYNELSGHDAPLASDTVSGTVKIYNVIGSNEDGTMTQKAITKELSDKIEMDVQEEEEMLVLDYDIKKS